MENNLYCNFRTRPGITGSLKSVKFETILFLDANQYEKILTLFC